MCNSFTEYRYDKKAESIIRTRTLHRQKMGRDEQDSKYSLQHTVRTNSFHPKKNALILNGLSTEHKHNENVISAKCS